MDLYFSHFLHQLIVEPIRITNYSITLIDHILMNSPGKVTQSGVIEVELFDHKLIYC